jgi:hypothetical protein
MVKGTDIVKQWDTTLDGDTRPNRIQLDGQMRELDEDELAERKKHAEYFGLDKSAEFEKKYLKAAETLKIQGENSKIEIDELTPCLRRESDGKIVNTTVVDVLPTREKFKDWEGERTV